MQMIDSDDKIFGDIKQKSEAVDTVSDDSMRDNNGNDGSSVSEIVALSIKAAAIALCFVVVILSLLSVIMPLSAMRVFKSLGNRARALDYAERYIESRLASSGMYVEGNNYYTEESLPKNSAAKFFTADTVDELGNFVILSRFEDICDNEFVEAVDNCISLSSTLMQEYEIGGKEATYYAERLERYTRMYLSLYSVKAIDKVKDENNVASVPVLAVRPIIYRNAHTVRKLNYRARTYLAAAGDNTALENMLFDSGSYNVVTKLITLSGTYGGLGIDAPDSRPLLISTLDGFVDYIGQLGEYLSVRLEALGVTRNLTELDFREGGEFYGLKLDGDEFSLFITPEYGFSLTYKNFYIGTTQMSYYSEEIVNFVNDGTVAGDEYLHKLYWMQELTSFTSKFRNMSMILYYNRDAFSVYSGDVVAEYSEPIRRAEEFSLVMYGGTKKHISELYSERLTEYIDYYSYKPQGEK